MNINKVNEKDIITRFINLVKIDSESYNEQNIIKYLTIELKKFGVKTYLQKVGDTGNLIAVLKGNKKGKPIFFNAHMDTVTPGKNIKPVITDKLIKSDGTTVLGSDDKAAIAMFLEGLKYITKHNIPHTDIYLVFTYAEEQGLIGAKHLNFGLIAAKYGYSFDGDGKIGTVILSAPTHYTYKLQIKGKASHAGIAPEKGKNAIKIASELILKIKTGKIDEETSANVGIIEGGRATNIVPDTVNVAGEVRSRNEDKLKKYISELKNTIKGIKAKHKTQIKFSLTKEYKGFSFSENSVLVKTIVHASKEIKVKPVFEHSNGGSDANIFNQNGLKCLNLGIGMQKVHSTDEFILKKDLINGLKLFISIIKNWE